MKNFTITPATQEFLSRLGYHLKSILPKGIIIDLTEKIGVSYGGSSFEITPNTHPNFRAILEKASEIINKPILGFDFIVDNIEKSPVGKRWGIIKHNSLPFINLHHYLLIGKPVNVAKYIWDL